MEPEQKTLSFSGTSKFVQHRKTRAPKADPSRKLSLGSMVRRDCARCGQREALFTGSICTACGADYSGNPERAKRMRRAVQRISNPATLRAPIAEGGENILALMAAKSNGDV